LSARSRLVVVVGLVLLVVACGGGSSATTQQPSGSTTTPTGAGTTTPTPTQPAPSGGSEDGEVMLEIDGTRYYLSVRDDIPMEALPSMNVLTDCNPSSLGAFLVEAVGVDAGVEHPALAISFMLNPDGTVFEDFGDFKVVVPAGGSRFNSIQYQLVLDDPGSWTVEGNRIHGDLNLFAGDRWTTAQFDATCPE